MDFTSLESGAIIKHPKKGLLLGKGPFLEQSHAPTQGVAFYINDFELLDPKPWKIPTELVSLEPLSEIESFPIHWQEPSPDAYAQVFEEIMRTIQSGQLCKCVPAMSELGTIPNGLHPNRLISHIIQPFHKHYQYAYWNQLNGFGGATPELLLSVNKHHLQTMALAGTARPEDANVFINDQKEILEHEIVARSILGQLSPLGKVQRTPRGILDLESVIHFHTDLTLEFEEPRSPEFWIQLLHPTPALGCDPKNTVNLQKLYSWRRQLRCPAHFGAPFGIYIDGEFTCFVAIRGFSWSEQKVSICAGGGVVAGSSLTHEWRELKLKRTTIKNRFHL